MRSILVGPLVLTLSFWRMGAPTNDPRPAVMAALPPAIRPVDAPRVPAKRVPRIQAAILLDTSSSMSGLIDQARAQLWKMVNEFSRANRGGVRPSIEVALYEYGKSSLTSESGYVRRIVPLTTDLDRISEELFALSTGGGDEYCGRALSEAARGLEWSSEDDDVKVVFIAGNEPFDQGPVNFRGACAELVKRGVIVNAIHCGSAEEGRSQNWAAGARAGHGKYLWIDQNRQAVHVAAPQDELISKLGVELNATYLAFGHEGRVSAQRQSLQDSNSMQAGSDSLVQRAMFKASSNYRNSRWDLVDAVREGNAKLAEVKDESLPAAMKGMSGLEREVFVKKQAACRAQLQLQIAQLSADRERWLSRKASAAAGPATLDVAMIEAVRAMARDRGYRFE